MIRKDVTGMMTGKYGIRIKNIEAGTLYEYNNGVRDHFEYKNAIDVYKRQPPG